mgnify:FL=1
MRKLKPNEKIIKEYDRYILVEVKCPNGSSYKTTIDKWTSKDKAKVDRTGNKFNYKLIRR